MKAIKKLILLWLCMCLIMPYAMAENTTLLKVGSQGAQTRTLQERLVELGFLNSLPDGKFGKATKDAVLSFQRAANRAGFKLSVDGIAGQNTLGLIYDDQKMQDLLTFGLNEKSLRAMQLQTRLYDLNFLPQRPDGIFGPNTEEALKAFQRHAQKNGADIEITGKRDLKTKNLLLSEDLKTLNIQAPEFFDESNPLSLNQGYIAARSCILIDALTGDVLFEKDADKKMYPASTTKAMTLLCALENADIDSIITIPKEALDVPKDSSLVPVYPDEKMKLKDLLYGLMVRSGNDAANAVAMLVSGSIDKFVDTMNQKAKSMGLSNTHFTNPHGYHNDEHYTTSRDLSILALYAMQNYDFYNISQAADYVMPATARREELKISTKSSIILPSSQYFYPYAIGIKSGFTTPAGNCYIGSAFKDGKYLIAVVMDCRTRPHMWLDLKHMFEYGFAKLENNNTNPAP
ncbi:MAG: peptidoglycan-binding protein [Eubacteriales bacterium]|nr:peptidoglycan-binding protein [Eubacteriales bacterium]